VPDKLGPLIPGATYEQGHWKDPSRDQPLLGTNPEGRESVPVTKFAWHEQAAAGARQKRALAEGEVQNLGGVLRQELQHPSI